MPAIRTEITEIVTGLGMFGYPNLEHALGMRPPGFQNVDDPVYDSLAAAYRSGGHSRVFAGAWSNGVRFARSAEGLRGRPPWIVEWKGAHRPPGYEQLPADLRVDHVYLVSCKYGSNILTNSSPANLFDPRPGEDDWFIAVAPESYQLLYDECRHLVPEPSSLPGSVTDSDQGPPSGAQAVASPQSDRQRQTGLPGVRLRSRRRVIPPLGHPAGDQDCPGRDDVAFAETAVGSLLRAGGVGRRASAGVSGADPLGSAGLPPVRLVPSTGPRRSAASPS